MYHVQYPLTSKHLCRKMPFLPLALRLAFFSFFKLLVRVKSLHFCLGVFISIKHECSYTEVSSDNNASFYKQLKLWLRNSVSRKANIHISDRALEWFWISYGNSVWLRSVHLQWEVFQYFVWNHSSTVLLFTVSWYILKHIYLDIS